MKALSQVIKWFSVFTAAGAQLTPFIPEQFTGWAVLLFMAISAIKDNVLIPAGDMLDDGKLNQTFKG